MKYKGNNMKNLFKIVGYLAIFALALFLYLSWPVNLYKLTKCDFEPDYKCEVLHGAGLIPIVSVITVWVETDD